VWWAQPSLAGGSRKRRPFLVVSHDAFNRNGRYPKVMVVHLTSVQRVGADFPWEVRIARGEGGLPAASVAKCGEVYTLLKNQLESRAGMLRAEKMEQIDAALVLALGLPA
jgi:mRNA-degrading endonuclease toxin of MazEF toxin-antitoxin module